MGKKKKPNPALQSKLIIPGVESKPKSQLLVPDADVAAPGARLSIPGAGGQPGSPRPILVEEGIAPEGAPVDADEAGDQFMVINEDAAAPAEEEEEPAPVRITAMVPPPVEPDPQADVEAFQETAPVAEEEFAEPVVAVALPDPSEEEIFAEESPVEQEQAYAQPEYAEDQTYQQPYEDYEDYAAPEEPFAGQAPSETWEQPQAQAAYYDPAQSPYQQGDYDPAQQQPHYPAPAPVPAPSFAPPRQSPPPPQHPPMHQQAHYGYGGPPVAPGYQMPGQMPGGMYGRGFPPQRNVPSWALVLVGLLVGFLMAMAIFKFTGMGVALRGDLIEEGQRKAEKKYQAKIKSLQGGDDEADEPEPEPKNEKVEDPPEDKPDAADEADEADESDKPAEDENAEE